LESPTRMPALFVGHGSPMNTLEHNRFTTAWHEVGRRIESTVGRPRAILAISAHWYINAAAVTAMSHPRVIHDFYGFPDELFAFDYPAPGDPTLAAEVVELATPTWIGLDADSWGLDHGTWSVLAHMFPDADVPVVQLSIDAGKSAADHVALGARLAPLRDRGVLVVASGNVVHHLGRIDWSRPEGGTEWAERFDAATRAQLTDAPGDAARLAEHPDFALAAPTPDHFIPALYLAGLAAAGDDPVTTFAEGCVMGSLSMTSFELAGR
jgi:4,5-DOPA dioxygenase extradiol